jgi:hypothetical protein
MRDIDFSAELQDLELRVRNVTNPGRTAPDPEYDHRAERRHKVS